MNRKQNGNNNIIGNGSSPQPKIKLIPGTDFEEEMFDFGKILENRGFSYSIDRSATELTPSVKVGDNFIYRGIPQERELDPFMEYLEGNLNVPSEMKEKISSLKALCHVDLYLSPTCTFCPGVVRKISPLTYFSPKIELYLVDVTRFENLAGEKKVRSVPTTVIRNRLRFTGDLNLESFVSALSADSSSPDFRSLKQMIDEGNARFIADAMIADGMIYDAFVSLLTHAEWSVRVGAMVAMEELIGRDPELARTIIESLTIIYHGKEESVKGDILYIIGEIGDGKHIRWLTSVAETEQHPEVVDAAEAAIDEILSRQDQTS